MHLTLAIHLLHWPSSPIHTRPNILFKLRCTSLHPQVPILPLCWSSSCPNILFKLHCPANQNAHSAFMPSGQGVANTLSSWQLLQSDKIGSLAYNNASWISIAQKNKNNILAHLIALTSMIHHQNLNQIPNRILFRSILFSEASIEIERNFTKCWVNVSNWIPTRPLWNVNVFCKLGSDNTQSRQMLEGQN